MGVLVPELSEGLHHPGTCRAWSKACCRLDISTTSSVITIATELIEQAQTMMIERAVDGFVAIDTVSASASATAHGHDLRTG